MVSEGTQLACSAFPVPSVFGPEVTVPTSKESVHPRGLPLVTRMQELQASRRVIPIRFSNANFCSQMSTVLARSWSRAPSSWLLREFGC
jgi:hypothetical protein